MTVHAPSRRRGPSPKSILTRDLKAAGLRPAEVRPRLPFGWEETLEEDGGLLEIRAFVAKHFGLRLTPEGGLVPRPDDRVRFKSTAGIEPGALDAARAAAVAVARLVAAATVPPWVGTLPAAAALRCRILDAGRPWIALEDLVAACWRHGVPVVYLPQLPVEGRKMDGLVTEIRSRPVVVLAKGMDNRHPAWASFILAHEMGHIALGHLAAAGDDTIVDGDLDLPSEDADERAANCYAVEVLTGCPTRPSGAPRRMAAPTFARAALSVGRERAIEPGHLALSWARAMGERDDTSYYALANRAQALLGFGAGDVRRICESALDANLDLDRLPGDSVDFLAASGVIADA